MTRKVWTTLLTKTHYIQAALILEQSLKDVGSKYPLVVMIAPDLDPRLLDILRVRNIATRPIDYLQPAPGRHEVAAHDERFRETWTKLRAFDLDEYEVHNLTRSAFLKLTHIFSGLFCSIPT
jgi:hypothetical protein